MTTKYNLDSVLINVSLKFCAEVGSSLTGWAMCLNKLYIDIEG